MAKADVDIGVLDRNDDRTPRGQRGGCQTEWQRKPGTTRGSPRRSRTAKASRISRHAVKSRCAHEWDGWGRLSDDGSGHYNPNPSEDPWGGGVITLQGRAQSSPRPDTVRTTVVTTRCTKGGCKLDDGRRMPGAGVSRWRSSLHPPFVHLVVEAIRPALCRAADSIAHRLGGLLLLHPRGPRSGSGYSVPIRHHLIDPIRPTRGHIAISPQSGLYAMPSLCGSA